MKTRGSPSQTPRWANVNEISGRGQAGKQAGNKRGPGDKERAQGYLQEIAHAQAEGPHSDGLGVIAASRTLGTCEGERYYASLHTGATAWYALALQGADPFGSSLPV